MVYCFCDSLHINWILYYTGDTFELKLVQFLSNFLFGKICLHLFYFSNAKFVQQMWPFVGKYQILPPFDGIRFGMFVIMCTMNIFGECRRKMAALFYSSLSWEIYWSDLFLLDRFICSIQAWQDTEYQVDISPKLDLASCSSTDFKWVGLWVTWVKGACDV